MLGDPGEVIRAHLKKTKQLKLTVQKRIGKAYDTEETESLATKAKNSRSPQTYPAFMLVHVKLACNSSDRRGIAAGFSIES